MYKTWIVKEKEYKLRLTAKNCIELERALGENPLNIFVGIDERHLPPISKLILILHYSLQSLEHGINLDTTYNLYDSWVEEGHTITDFINLIINVLQDAGFIPKEEDSSKN